MPGTVHLYGYPPFLRNVIRSVADCPWDSSFVFRPLIWKSCFSAPEFVTLNTTTPRLADFALSVKLRSFAVTLTLLSSAALCGAFATDGELAASAVAPNTATTATANDPITIFFMNPPSDDDSRDRNRPKGAMRASDGHPTLARIPLRVPSPLCAVLLAVVALTLSACSSEESSAGSRFEPVHPGVLTVATAFLPAPGFWEGNPPTSGGFEAGLAQAIAEHLGLDRVKVVQVPFASIVEGKLGGADLALSQLTPTDEREKIVDFSTPYLSAPPAILALRTVDANDVHGLQELSWVTSRVSTLTPFVQDRIRPKRAPLVVEDRTAALAVLRRGGADALMLDLPVAEGLARSDPDRFHVLGQLDADEGLAAALPQGSHNVEVVDSAIRSLNADGTIHDLVQRWLGEDQNDVPLILTEERR